jgi:flagellar basal body-associated protein FliL
VAEDEPGASIPLENSAPAPGETLMRQLSNRSGKKILLVAIVVALVVGAVAGGVILGPKLLKHGKKSATADKKSEDKKSEDKKSEDKKSGDDTGVKTGDTDEKKAAVVVPLGEFLVNLASGGGVRYLKAEVSVALTGLPEKKKGEGEGKQESPLPPDELAIAKDRVVAVLSAGDFAQLRNAAGREALKQKVKARVQEGLPDYEVTQVLFTSFVMQ